MNREIMLTLTEDQAAIVSRACEFYCRIFCGQFQEIPYELMFHQSMADGEWCYRREKAEEVLLEARKYIYPELRGAGHSYGVGKFQNADTAWNVYQVLRYVLGDERKPFALFGEELPKYSVITSESTIVDDSEIQHVSYNDEQLGRNK